MKNVHQITIGEVWEPLKKFNRPGVNCQLQQGGFTIMIGLKNPTNQDIDNIISSIAEFTTLRKNDAVFLTGTFNKTFSFDSGIIPLDDTHLKKIHKGYGYSLFLIIHNTETAIIEGHRLIGLGHKFSKEIQRLLKSISYTSAEDLIKRIIDAQLSNTTEQLIRLSQSKYMVGEEEVF